MNSHPIRVIPGASSAAVLDLSDEVTGLGMSVIQVGNYMVLLADDPEMEPEQGEEEVCLHNN